MLPFRYLFIPASWRKKTIMPIVICFYSTESGFPAYPSSSQHPLFLLLHVYFSSAYFNSEMPIVYAERNRKTIYPSFLLRSNREVDLSVTWLCLGLCGWGSKVPCQQQDSCTIRGVGVKTAFPGPNGEYRRV